MKIGFTKLSLVFTSGSKTGSSISLSTSAACVTAMDEQCLPLRIAMYVGPVYEIAAGCASISFAISMPTYTSFL